MSDDDKDLKDPSEEGDKEGGVLSDSVLDAFDEAAPVELEDDLLKPDPFTTDGEDDEVPLDSGDYGTTDEW